MIDPIIQGNTMMNQPNSKGNEVQEGINKEVDSTAIDHEGTKEDQTAEAKS